jgi:hypothetical protein
MPILIGVVGLLLLGVLGYGLWLIAAEEDAEPGLVPTPTVAVPTAAPTTERPSPTAAPTTEAQQVRVPDLVGMSLDDAQAELEDLGLTYRVRYQTTAEQEPGAVLETRPDSGSRVEPGSRVTLTVAAAPPTQGPPTPTAPGTGDPD